MKLASGHAAPTNGSGTIWNRLTAPPVKKHLYQGETQMSDADRIDEGEEDIYGPLMVSAWEWEQFESGLRSSNRFVAGPEEYLDRLLEGCRACSSELAKDTTLFRGRLHRPESGSQPWQSMALLPPAPDSCTAGRLNPEGIPYFYLASTRQTAVAEIRPWRGAQITVGGFNVTRNTQVVDLRPQGPETEHSSPVGWATFMLSRPVHQGDRLRYVATQYLAERLKSEGFEGMLYQSSLEPRGYNVALFDTGLATYAKGSRTVHSVHAVDYATSEFGGPFSDLGEDLSSRTDDE